MQGGDLSNKATPRVWVLEDVVLTRDHALVVNEQPVKKHWWSRRPKDVVEAATVPVAVSVNRAAMSLLWRYAQRWADTGLRFELVHVGDGRLADSILALLDTHASSVFADVLVFEDLAEVVDQLPYRPDVLHVVADGREALKFGGRGMALQDMAF